MRDEREMLGKLNINDVTQGQNTLFLLHFYSKIRHLPEAHKFRAKYEFGTYDYLLAAHVTEALHGRSWDDDVQRLFNKIGRYS